MKSGFLFDTTFNQTTPQVADEKEYKGKCLQAAQHSLLNLKAECKG
jgi:hypothetical protein